MTHSLPEKDLVLRAQSGSQDAFAELYNRYKQQILNYLYGYIGNFATAQELTQDAFMSAYKNIAHFKGESKFSTWVYAIATNIAKNYIISNKKKHEESMNRPVGIQEDITLEDVLPDNRLRPDELAENDMLQEEIQRVLNDLPEIYRQPILLCDVEGFSYEEAAEVLKCNVGTVGSRLSEARKMFRKKFNIRRGAKG